MRRGILIPFDREVNDKAIISMQSSITANSLNTVARARKALLIRSSRSFYTRKCTSQSNHAVISPTIMIALQQLNNQSYRNLIPLKIAADQREFLRSCVVWKNVWLGSAKRWELEAHTWSIIGRRCARRRPRTFQEVAQGFPNDGLGWNHLNVFGK